MPSASIPHPKMQPCHCSVRSVANVTPLCLCPADIQAGQGLYYEAITKTWRAKDCGSNSYGVTSITFGLTPAPCKACPNGLTATKASNVSAQYFVTNTDGSGGFNSEKACVTLPGKPSPCWMMDCL